MDHVNFPHSYFGIFFMLILASALFYIIIQLSAYVGKKFSRQDTEKLKLTIYECGPQPTYQPNKISVQFYIFGLLFILFDVEIIFMFPWALDFHILRWFGFAEMITFIVLLAIGFVYAWKKGALEWQSIK